MQQLNNAADCRSRGPLKSPIFGLDLDSLARRAVDEAHVTWGSKKKREFEKIVAVKFKSGYDEKNTEGCRGCYDIPLDCALPN